MNISTMAVSSTPHDVTNNRVLSTITANTTTVTTPNTTDIFDATTGGTTASFSPWVTENDGGNVSECAQGLVWIYDHLGQCYESPTQLLAFSLAVIAIGLWFVAHIILFKSQREDADCSCSRLCLLFAAGLGSVCNLVGCTLCDQLGTQVLTACYLVFSDVVFLIQWIHSWNRNRKLNMQGLSFYVASSDDWKSPGRAREEHAMNGGGSSVGGGGSSEHALVLSLCAPCFVTLFCTLALPWQQSPDMFGDTMQMSTGGRKLLMVSETPTDNLGYALGFVALSFYTVCRIPTIINEFRHKITFREPLAAHVLEVLASFSYLFSIVAYDTDSIFLINALPWLLMSLALAGLDSILIFIVKRNRSVGPKGHQTGRRRPDGTFLLSRSEESLNSDLERNATLRFTDDAAGGTAPVKLPSIQEEPHHETHEETEIIPDSFTDINKDFDVETVSIHSRASDFILDDDEDVYVRGDEDDNDKAVQPDMGREKNFDDDGLEWDFDDFRPRYTETDDGLHDVKQQHHSFSASVDDEDDDGVDDWDEERVLSEIERELQINDEVDTISMEYDTADDEDQFYQGGSYSYKTMAS